MAAWQNYYRQLATNTFPVPAQPQSPAQDVLTALGGCLAVLVIGSRINGARRWIEFGPATFQPSELAKLAVAVWVAAYLCKRPAPRSLHELWRPIAVLTVPLNAPYQDGVRQLMPDAYEAQALAGFADPEVPRSVVQRYNALNSPSPGP